MKNNEAFEQTSLSTPVEFNEQSSTDSDETQESVSSKDIILQKLIDFLSDRRTWIGTSSDLVKDLSIDVSQGSIGRLLSYNSDFLQDYNIKYSIKDTSKGKQHTFINNSYVYSDTKNLGYQEKVIITDGPVIKLLERYLTEDQKKYIIATEDSIKYKNGKKRTIMESEYELYIPETKTLFIVTDDLRIYGAVLQRFSIKKTEIATIQTSNLTEHTREVLINYLRKFKVDTPVKTKKEFIIKALATCSIINTQIIKPSELNIVNYILNTQNYSDLLVAKFVMSRLVGFWIKIHGEKYSYLYHEGRWVYDIQFEHTKKIIESCIEQLTELTQHAYSTSSARVSSTQKLLLTLRTPEDSMFLVHKRNEAREYIAFKNGILNLNTLELEPHNPEIFLTQRLSYNCPDLNIKKDYRLIAPNLAKFLYTSLPDQDIRKYVQKLAGLSLLGVILELFHILIGPGGDGKGTFIYILQLLLEKYALIPVDRSLLLAGSHTQHPVRFASLEGKRLVVAEELSGDLDLSVVKTLSGGDMISARHIGEGPYQFAPEFTMIGICNTLFKVPARETALWRRVRVIPFGDNKIKEHDPELKWKKLPKELEGICRWAIDGLKLYYKEGLIMPDNMKKVTEDWKEESKASDTVYYFHKNNIEIIDNPKYYIITRNIYRRYKEFLTNNNKEQFAIQNQDVFTKRLLQSLNYDTLRKLDMEQIWEEGELRGEYIIRCIRFKK